MKVVYYKLFDILKDRNIMQKTLIEDINLSGSIMQKIRRNENVTTETIGKICEYLRVQPSDVMEIIYDDDIENIRKQREIAELERKLEILKNS